MSPRKSTSHSHATSSTVEEAVIASPPPVTEAPPAAAVVAQVPATSPPPTPTAPPTPTPPIYLTPPPKDALIPGVPASFIPDSGTSYKGVTPRKAELVTLPLALADLQKFTGYTQALGTTAPPYAEIVATFEVTNEWSSMRTASSAWDVYCRDQEGICWTVMRPGMEALKSAFDLAATRDPSLTAKLPGLAALLGVKQAIAQRGASTRRLNTKAKAEGKPPTHGAVGKRRQKAAEKAIVAAATAGTNAQVQSALVQSAAPVVAAPVAATVAPAAPSAPVVSANGAAVAVPATPASGVAPGTNGAGH